MKKLTLIIAMLSIVGTARAACDGDNPCLDPGTNSDPCYEWDCHTCSYVETCPDPGTNSDPCYEWDCHTCSYVEICPDPGTNSEPCYEWNCETCSYEYMEPDCEAEEKEVVRLHRKVTSLLFQIGLKELAIDQMERHCCCDESFACCIFAPPGEPPEDPCAEVPILEAELEALQTAMEEAAEALVAAEQALEDCQNCVN